MTGYLREKGKYQITCLKISDSYTSETSCTELIFLNKRDQIFKVPLIPKNFPEEGSKKVVFTSQ